MTNSYLKPPIDSIYSLETTPKKRNNGSQSVYTEAFRRIAESPADPTTSPKVYRPRPRSYGVRSYRKSPSLSGISGSGECSSSGSEEASGEQKELVMCLACRRVYPSRRFFFIINLK